MWYIIHRDVSSSSSYNPNIRALHGLVMICEVIN